MSEINPDDLDPRVIVDMRLYRTKRSSIEFTSDTLPTNLFSSSSYYNSSSETFNYSSIPLRQGYHIPYFYNNLFIRITVPGMISTYLGRIIATWNKTIIMDLINPPKIADTSTLLNFHIFAKHNGNLNEWSKIVVKKSESNYTWKVYDYLYEGPYSSLWTNDCHFIMDKSRGLYDFLMKFVYLLNS